MTSELVPWRGHHVPVLEGEISRYSLTDYFNWANQSFNFGGITYYGQQGYTTTYGKRPAEPIGNNFAGYVEGMLYRDGVVAAVEWTRVRVFSQAPLLFQERTDGRPGDLYDDESLDLVRRPWPGGTTSDLLTRALLYADFGGNAYIVRADDELVVLRPDWVEIVLAERFHNGSRLGFRQVGIAYYEGGLSNGDPAVFMRGEYAHFAPLPDPLANYRGMSWLTPVIREIQSDIGATTHGVAFWENAATPNLAVSLPKEVTPAQFNEFVEKMDAKHKGAAQAYKTLYTGGGADVTVVGANMQQMDFSRVQGKVETRIANAAGVHPVIVGLSEGMQGSSLNAGNYSAAKRNFVDTTARHLWQNWCGSLEVLFPPPTPGARLWYDGRDIPFLHEDAKDLAEIQGKQQNTITGYVMQGFEADSAIAAVNNDDVTLLKHSGLVSVQLLPPGMSEPTGDVDGDGFPDEPADEELEDPFEAEDEYAALRSEIQRKYNPLQPRIPKGSLFGGRWTLTGAIRQALKAQGGTPGGAHFPDGRYFDWSIHHHDRGRDTYTFEVGNGGDPDYDEEVVSVDIDDADMDRLLTALTQTRIRDAVPKSGVADDQAVALATLANVTAPDAVTLGKDENLYIDWSERTADGNYALHVENSDEDQSIDFELTPAEFAQLVASLTLSTQADDAARSSLMLFRGFGEIEDLTIGDVWIDRHYVQTVTDAFDADVLMRMFVEPSAAVVRDGDSVTLDRDLEYEVVDDYNDAGVRVLDVVVTR